MDSGNLKAILPIKKIFTFDDFKIGLIHGWGPAGGLEDRLRPEFAGINCLVYGHSHKPANYWSDGVLFFNPGSASRIGFFRKPTIGFIHIDDSGLKGEILEI
jgi:predicted phosphodiesterase